METKALFKGLILGESGGMYLRCNRRLKDGKEHRYWNIVESKRCGGGKVVQRNVLYLGEINDSQRESWCQVIEAFDEGTRQPTQLALFPAERAVPDHARAYGVQVRLNEMQLHHPRQWGACWLACVLYEQLDLDEFWRSRLPDCRLQTLERYICRRWRSGDVPSDEVPALYHDFVRRGNPYRLVPVFHHNLLDVITMGEILRALCRREPARAPEEP